MTTLSDLTAAADIDNGTLLYGVTGANSRKFTHDQLVPTVYWCSAATGSANAIEVTTDKLEPETSLDGHRFTFIATATNTSTTVTIGINGRAGVALTFPGGAVPPVGYIQSGLIYDVLISGANYYLGQAGSAAGSYIFTPTVRFATPGDSSFVYGEQSGRWSLSGAVMNFTIDLDFTTNAYTTASGAFEILGLPIQAKNLHSPVSIGRWDNFNYLTGDNEVGGHVVPSSSAGIQFRVINDESAGGSVNPARVPPSTNFVIWVGGSYIVA